MMHFKQDGIYEDGVPLRGPFALKLKTVPAEAEVTCCRYFVDPPKEQYHGPMCRCGSRNTARIGDSALTRQCQSCGQTYAYRLKDGLLIPYALETALALEGK